jgi:uncharacterized protein
MKYVLIIAIVLGVLWVLRQQRGGRSRPGKTQASASPPPPPPPSGPTEIVECAHCQLHLPRAEAVTGPAGHFCSEAHRREAEGG